MTRRSKQGFVLSALLHGGVVSLAILLPMLDLSDRKAENQFELVAMPPLSGAAGGGFESAPPSTRDFDFNGPDNVSPPPAPQPQRKPQPTQAKPPPPTPQKKPPTPSPTPTKTPTPPPTIKPAPAPAKTPAPAPTMSYDEWVKKFGPPKPTTTKKPTTTTGGTGSSGRAKGPRVDTDFSGVVRDSVVGGSRYGSLTGTEMSALGLYIAEIKGALEDAWPQPTGLADSLTTNVEFSVTAEGRIYGMRVVKSSGNPAYDQSVAAAFAGVGGVGPTPDGKPLNLRLTFKMNDM